MGSSDRSDLNNGYDRDNSDKLQAAADLIEEVVDCFLEGHAGTPEDAADDGAFVARMRVAASLIEEELPPRRRVAPDTTDNELEK